MVHRGPHCSLNGIATIVSPLASPNAREPHYSTSRHSMVRVTKREREEREKERERERERESV